MRYQKLKNPREINLNGEKNNCLELLLQVELDSQGATLFIEPQNLLTAKSLILIASVIVGGKGGGGRKDMAQAGGNNKYKIPEMFEALKNEIKKTI